MLGHVFNVQSFSVQDGPGIRTTVFFSGCNLRCAWCHNPESWQATPQLLFDPARCIGCGSCFAACPRHRMAGEAHAIDRALCTGCGRCADGCYAGALRLCGQALSVEALWETLQADLPYYRNSGGGVTFSGGECMLQPLFLQELLALCARHHVHTAVDTAGHVPYAHFAAIRPDLYLYDLKAVTPEVHKRLTGVDGVLIWENLRRLLADGARVLLRIPCVPDANWEELPRMAEALASLPVSQIELLPYHRLGEGKFHQLAREAALFTTPTDAQMERATALFQAPGRTVHFAAIKR